MLICWISFLIDIFLVYFALGFQSLRQHAKAVILPLKQKQLVKDFIVGDAVQVSGFLNRHESNNGTPIIALHAQQIERLN